MSRSAKIRSLRPQGLGSGYGLFGSGCGLMVRGGLAASGDGWRRRRGVVAVGLVLALDSLQSPNAADDVAVDGGAEGVFDGGADEGDLPVRDRGVRFDKFVHQADDPGKVPLKDQGGEAEGFLAVAVKLGFEIVVLAEPAAQGTLADVGLAGGGGNGAGGEQGADGAFLAGGESVAEVVGVGPFHIFKLTGGWRGIWG